MKEDDRVTRRDMLAKLAKVAGVGLLGLTCIAPRKAATAQCCL